MELPTHIKEIRDQLTEIEKAINLVITGDIKKYQTDNASGRVLPK